MHSPSHGAYTAPATDEGGKAHEATACAAAASPAGKARERLRALSPPLLPGRGASAGANQLQGGSPCGSHTPHRPAGLVAPTPTLSGRGASAGAKHPIMLPHTPRTALPALPPTDCSMRALGQPWEQ